MKQRKISRWIIAILVVCLVSTFALTACKRDKGDPTGEATYYLSIDGATYDSESSVPTNVKFTKSGDVYTLTIELEAGKILTINKIGSDDKIGYDKIFSSAGKLTQGANNSMVVAEKGTFALTLDASVPELTYAFTAAVVGGETKVTGVSLNKKTLTLAIEGTEKLIATVAPSTAINKGVTWSSSNNSVASVAQDGTVTAVGSGTATITVTTTDGGFTDTCQVTVPQSVASISLSSEAITVYTGEGAGTRELTVTITPEDATNKDYFVNLDQTEEFIKAEKAGITITITGLKVGTATLTVTSAEDSTLTASCTVTVKDISESAPALSKDNIDLDIEGEETIEILLDSGEITSFTATTTANETISIVKNDEANTFTVTATGFGTATVTVAVTYDGTKTENLTLTVRVSASYYFLTGNFDGTDWGTPVKVEGYLTTYNVLLEEKETGIYEITRNFAANEKFYILPSTGDFWTNALKKGFYKAQTGGSNYFETPDSDNVQIKYAGNYTVRLDITGEKASWTIIVNSVEYTAIISPNAPSLKVGETTSSTLLTLSFNPSVVTVPASSIEWSVKEANYSELVTLSVGGDALSCTVALTDKFTGEENVTLTILVTITVEGETIKTAERQVALLGETITPVTEVTFDDATDVITYDVTNKTPGEWKFPVTAHVDENATVKTITYTIKEGTIYANDDQEIVAFAIDGDGKVTARMFGTFTVVATADGVDRDGQHPYAEKTVRVYSQKFYVSINWAQAADTNASTTTDYITHTWTGVKLAVANQPVLFLYEGLGANSWETTVRSGGYLDSKSTAGAIGSVTGSGDGCFKVLLVGMYDITLDLSKSKPSVKFIRTGDIQASESKEDYQMTVSIYGKGDTWVDSGAYATVTGTISPTNEQYTLTLTHTFNETKFANWSKSSWPGIEIVTKKNSESETWGSGLNPTFTADFSGMNQDGSSGGVLWAESDLFKNYELTFVFTFDNDGVLTKIEVTRTALAA